MEKSLQWHSICAGEKCSGFVKESGLDIMAFINKYGKVVDETDYFTAYAIGCHVEIIDK